MALAACLALLTPDAPAQSLESYSPANMAHDLASLRSVLLAVHPGTLQHQSQLRFEEHYSAALEATRAPLRPTEYYRVVLRLIASIGDGHTQAFGRGGLRQALDETRRLPLRVHVQDGRLFLAEQMPAGSLQPGSEILAIDGRLSGLIVTEMLDHYSGDGPSNEAITHWLGGPYRPFGRIYAELYGDAPEFTLTLRAPGKEAIQTRAVTSMAGPDFEEAAAEWASVAQSRAAVSCENVSGFPAVGRLTVTRLIDQGFDEPESVFVELFDRCFADLRRMGVEALIVDLRDNGGGKASNGALLLSHLVDEAITPAIQITTMGDDPYYQERTGQNPEVGAAFGLRIRDDGRFQVTRSDALRELRSFEPQAEVFEGQLIVLVNGGTASAGAITAGLLREHAEAVVVGTETFGYAGVSNGVRNVVFRGTHTEVGVSIPLLHAEYRVHPSRRGKNVRPDYRVAPTIDDILGGRDAVMEYALTSLLSTRGND